MRNVILYIAVSVDGCIADPSGSVAFLAGQPADPGDDSYAQLLQRVDTVVMGWNTYHQVVTELSPGRWVYGDLQAYVITHRSPPATEGIVFTGEHPAALIQRLRQQPGKDIWICGGASIVQALMERDLIDEFILSLIPTVLGAGIRLFGPLLGERRLEWVATKQYGGIVQLHYRSRRRQGG